MTDQAPYVKYEEILEKLPEKTKLFFKFHGLQLMNMGFPAKAMMIEQLHCKLEGDIFDCAKYTSLMDN